MSDKKPALGRGLADLLGGSRARASAPAAAVPIAPAASDATAAPRAGGDELAHLPVEQLTRGKYPPRSSNRMRLPEGASL